MHILLDVFISQTPRACFEKRYSLAETSPFLSRLQPRRILLYFINVKCSDNEFNGRVFNCKSCLIIGINLLCAAEGH